VCGTRSLVGLERFLQETEHFRRWFQEKVAKIVHCGEPRVEGRRWSNSGGVFYNPSFIVKDS
jgi:hypothetical protein